jgi:hypothetical protein
MLTGQLGQTRGLNKFRTSPKLKLIKVTSLESLILLTIQSMRCVVAPSLRMNGVIIAQILTGFRVDTKQGKIVLIR